MSWEIGQHSHPHGNHTHTHVHYRESAEHDGVEDCHGWHDPASSPKDAIDFDDTFGEESLSERKPSGLIKAQLDKAFDVTPDGEIVVVVPYVPGMLQVPVSIRRLATCVDLSGSQYDYFDLMLRLFKERRPFLIIEEDMAPTPEQIDTITKCPEPICAISYESFQGDVVEVFGDFGALGFICFKGDDVLSDLANALTDLGPVTWSRVDGHVYHSEIAMGYRPHIHEGSVEHRHVWPEGRRPVSRKRSSARADVTVLTCTIPGREELLARNMASVRDQRIKVEAHVVIADDGSLGTEAKYNRAAFSVETDWIAILDDDNYWLPNHVEMIAPYFEDADVIYTWDQGGSRPRVDISNYGQEDLLELFGSSNVLDQSCAIRRKFFERVGGFRQEFYPRSFADQDLWYRLALLGARFKAVQVETWVYDVNAPLKGFVA